jgi:hypothetical protein
MVPTAEGALAPRRDPRFGVEAWRAFRGCCVVGAAFIPLGLAFGVMVSHSGLPWWWAGVPALGHGARRDAVSRRAWWHPDPTG